MQHILSIQILRGLAALAIVVLHGFHDAQFLAEAQGWRFVVPEWPLGAGVDLFFVISGFVMVLASQRLFAIPGAPWQFLGRRLARIVPIYWAATTLFLLIMLARPEVLNSPLPDVSEVIRSYLFVPYVKPADGLIQPVYKLGWTLNYEMMFYAVFAGAVMLRLRQAVIGVTVFFAVLVGLGLALKPAAGMLAFWTSPMILEFVAGMWIATALISGVRLPRLLGMGLIGAGAVLVFLLPFFANDLERLAFWGGPAALMVAGASLGERGFGEENHEQRKVAPQGSAPHNAMIRALAALGDASYALYLCHPFAIRLFRLIWDKSGVAAAFGPGLPGAWAYILVATLAAIAAALPVYRLFELPVTKAVQGRIGVGRKR